MSSPPPRLITTIKPRSIGQTILRTKAPYTSISGKKSPQSCPNQPRGHRVTYRQRNQQQQHIHQRNQGCCSLFFASATPSWSLKPISPGTATISICQEQTAQSLCEAEIVATNKCITKLLHIRNRVTNCITLGRDRKSVLR